MGEKHLVVAAAVQTLFGLYQLQEAIVAQVQLRPMLYRSVELVVIKHSAITETQLQDFGLLEVVHCSSIVVTHSQEALSTYYKDGLVHYTYAVNTEAFQHILLAGLAQHRSNIPAYPCHCWALGYQSNRTEFMEVAVAFHFQNYHSSLPMRYYYRQDHHRNTAAVTIATAGVAHMIGDFAIANFCFRFITVSKLRIQGVSNATKCRFLTQFQCTVEQPLSFQIL